MKHKILTTAFEPQRR